MSVLFKLDKRMHGNEEIKSHIVEQVSVYDTVKAQMCL